MQALTLDHAKNLLRDSASVLDAALDSGLSGPGRLHDLFVTHEAMSPGEWKNGGAGMTLRFGFHASPFGAAVVIASDRGLAGLAFADPSDEPSALADMQRRWPRAIYLEDHAGTARIARRIFDPKLWRPDEPLRVILIGTDFEVRVWETLLKIPMGRAVCYSDIANKIRAPKASRAVGAAVGKNPISFVVPCHRALGKWAGKPGSSGCIKALHKLSPLRKQGPMTLEVCGWIGLRLRQQQIVVVMGPRSRVRLPGTTKEPSQSFPITPDRASRRRWNPRSAGRPRERRCRVRV
jgi:O-6-methylguanine DNA methyltransferase